MKLIYVERNGAINDHTCDQYKGAREVGRGQLEVDVAAGAGASDDGRPRSRVSSFDLSASNFSTEGNPS